MIELTTLRERLERFPLSILQLAMRIGVGAVFFRSGLLKLDSWEFTIQLFRDEYNVPLLDPILAAVPPRSSSSASLRCCSPDSLRGLRRCRSSA